MGVPKFFRYISERYPCLGELISDQQIPDFDNLYLDMNGIIHVCSHPNDFDPHFRISEEKIFSDIFHYLELLFGMIKPKQLFFMAVDGVAPRAKMNQQRGRRFRSAKEAEALEQRAKEQGQTLPESARFDSNCITPGTVFMVKLHEQLKYFITRKISEDPLWQRCTVILSGHETPGEGEHKIMDYIRYMKSQPGYNPNTRHCLYGLDADLIMLGLCSHEPHFSLLREEVKFGRQAKRQTAAHGVRFFLLHLSLMREYLDLEFQSLKSSLRFPYDLESVIDDWVLLSFLVGNDFIPNVPTMHIASGALPALYNAYKEVLPTLDGYINEKGTLNLRRFRIFMEKLAAYDVSQFKETYADLKYFEAKTGRKLNSKLKPFVEDDEEEEEENKGGTNSSKNKELADLIKATDDLYNDDAFEEEEVFQEVDCDIDDEDEDWDPSVFMSEFHDHKRNYYVEKMEYDKVTADVLNGQAEGYVRAIQWNLHYYYNGVASWSWFYPHHYAPYLSDICRFKDLDLNFDLGKPFRPFEQLLGVLPAASKSLLPEAYRWLMVEESSPIIEYYPGEFRTDLNGKAQDWEAVVLIPFISEERLLKAMAPCYDKLTEEEKARNKFGPMLIYNYSDKSSGKYKAPAYFPVVKDNLTTVKELWYNDVQLDRSKLIKGLLPGAKTDVYFPGFPTLRHIQFDCALKKASVAVFETLNRNESMILTFKERFFPELSVIAKNYIGKEVFINYPHLQEARVIGVATKDERYDLSDDPKNPIVKTELKDMASHQVSAEAETIANEYFRRRGIEIGTTEMVVYARSLEGKRGVSKNGQLVYEKQYVPTASPYALQAVVKDIPVYEPKEENLRIEEVFSPGSTCFMLAQPYYGSTGKVLKADDVKPGRIKVEMALAEQPNFDQVRHKWSSHDVYYAAHQAAQHIGINTLLLTRITGTVLLKYKLDGGNDHKETVHHIGLNLKSAKQNLMVPGYTRRNNNVWVYSALVLQELELFMNKFPDLFDKLTKASTTDLKVSDVFPGPDAKQQINEVKKFLAELPCSKVERVSCDSDILPGAIVEETEKTVDLYLNSKSSTRTGTMQVKPNTLYKSKLASGNLAPDPKAEHYLLDRIVIVRDDFIVPMGLKGTIIGIHKSEKANENRYDVLFDNTFPGAVSINSSTKRAFRITQSKFINITHGLRQACKNSVQPQGRYAFNNDSNSKRPSAFTSFNKQPVNKTPQNWRLDCAPPVQKPQLKNGPTPEKKTILSRDYANNPVLRGPEWLKFPPSTNAQPPAQPKQNPYPDVWAQLQNSKGEKISKPEEPRIFSGPPPASALPVPMVMKSDRSSSDISGERVRIAKKPDDDPMSEVLKKMLRIDNAKEQPKKSHPSSKPVLVGDMMAAAARAAKEAAASCSVSSVRVRPDNKPKGAILPIHRPAPQEMIAAPPVSASTDKNNTTALNVNELLSYYQNKGVGTPYFNFTKVSGGNEVEANVILPDQRKVSSGTCKDKREAAESAASAALSVLRREVPQAENSPMKDFTVDENRRIKEAEKEEKILEENISLHPGTLFQHFRTNAQNQQIVGMQPANMSVNQPVPGRFPHPPMQGPFNPVSPNKMPNWRAPPRNTLIHRPHPNRQDIPSQGNMLPFEHFLRGRHPQPQQPPHMRFNNPPMPFGGPSNWQQVRPYQQQQPQQPQPQQPQPQPLRQHQPQQPPFPLQPPFMYGQQLPTPPQNQPQQFHPNQQQQQPQQPQQQQQQPQQPQQQQQQHVHEQRQMSAPSTQDSLSTKRNEVGMAFVPLQAVKQQRNATKSAALLRREHLNNQAESTSSPGEGQSKQMSEQYKEPQIEEDRAANNVVKKQSSKAEGDAVDQFSDASNRKEAKETESNDKKAADLPSRPVSQMRRSRLAARFGPPAP